MNQFETRYIRTKDPRDAKKIFDISQNLLFSPAMFQKSSKKDRELFEKKGFVIGSHDDIHLEKWIQSPKNTIFLAQIKEHEEFDFKTIGFSLNLGMKETIEEVQQYAEDVEFCMPNARKVIESGKFTYLIQIGIDRGYENQGIGTQLFQEILNLSKVPVFSFVIKSPLHNYPSLHTHLKIGFQYMGDYTGVYGNFDKYRSIGLVYFPNTPFPSQELLKERYNITLQ